MVGAGPLYRLHGSLRDQEWMLGPDVPAPVVDQGATSRSVYFPAGCWREPETHATLLGPRSVTVTALLQRLPYYSRCGTSPFAVAGARRPSRTGPNAKPHRPRLPG